MVTSLYDIKGLERDAKQYMKSINLKLALGDVITQIEILERDVKFQTLKPLYRKISIVDVMNLKNIYRKLIIHIIELYLLIVFIFNFIACPRYVRTAGAKSLSVALRDRTFNLLLMDQMFHLCIT